MTRRPSARVRPIQSTTPALHPSQVRVIDWETEADTPRQLPARRPVSYVPAASEIVQMPRVQLASPDTAVTAEITPAATIESRTISGHLDRAQAWLRYSIPLCSTIAVGMVIAAVAFYRVPLLSFTALLILCGAFVLSYSLLLLNYWRHTPEGVALFHTSNLWDYLKAEQKHRHGIEREAWQDQRAISRKERP
jgi:CHASE2 domain-containing sensor protein